MIKENIHTIGVDSFSKPEYIFLSHVVMWHEHQPYFKIPKSKNYVCRIMEYDINLHLISRTTFRRPSKEEIDTWIKNQLALTALAMLQKGD